MSGLNLAGDVYLDRYVNGTRVGEYGPINARAFNITLPEANTITRKSYKRDSYGNTLDSVVQATGSGSVSVEIDDADPDILAMALLGTVGDNDASSGSVTDENVTAAHDLWRKLDHRSVSNVVVQDVTDTTTYVSGTDYTINASSGMIKVLSSGSIADGATLHVDYDYAALTSRQILAVQDTEVRSFVRLDGTNLANQKKVELTIPEAALIPSGDIGLISDDFVTYTLSGEIILRDGESAAFTYNEID